MKHLTLAALLALGAGAAAAQPRPPWMWGDMPPQTNSTYYFKVVSGSGATQQEARSAAMSALAGEMAQGQGVVIKGQSAIAQTSQMQGGREDVQSNFSHTYTMATDGFDARFEIADQHCEGSQCWLLVEVAHNPRQARFDRIEFTTDYRASALWRSAIAPGWGQMYKGSIAKGIVILSAEAAGIAGAVICDNLRSAYYHKTIAERSSDVRSEYQNRTATFRNLRNGFIVGAVGIYAFNIIDVLAAKGARRYKLAAAPQGMVLSIYF